MNITDYFDLTLAENDISKLSIKRRDNFNCKLVDEDGTIYVGFLLAKSNSVNAFTVCDIDFQKSQTDNKFPPRLTFRRTNKKLEDKKVGTNSEVQRILEDDCFSV